jgi:hypothetical protein
MFSRPAAQVSHEIAFDVTPLSNQIAALCAEIQMLPGLELSGRLSVSRSTLNDFISVWLYFFATVPETGTEQHRLGAIYFDANILRLSHNKASQRLDPALYKVPTEELFRDGDLLTTFVVIHILKYLRYMADQVEVGNPILQRSPSNFVTCWDPYPGRGDDETGEDLELSSHRPSGASLATFPLSFLSSVFSGIKGVVSRGMSQRDAQSDDPQPANPPLSRSAVSYQEL